MPSSQRHGPAGRIPVGLSTASVWPQRVSTGFDMAAALGFDGVEVMVWADPDSQDVSVLRTLSRTRGVPVLAVHAPCLLITQRVWSHDPTIRLRMAAEAAQDLGASTVVVHPPFRWQLRYADRFADLLGEIEADTGVAIAVENMFPVRPLGVRQPMAVSAFAPSIDPTDVGYSHYTLDLSHTSAAKTDARELAARMGSRLIHLHLADGSGAPGDEHLIPGRGDQPCAQVCENVAAAGFRGQVVVEVNTRQASTPARRATELAEALLFARLHLG